MRAYFRFDLLGTNYRRETLGGITTFFAMAYIIVVNPAVLSAGGVPQSANMTATILAAAFGTLVMALYARRPFAIATYMGENAFFAYSVCLAMGYSWQQALGAVFVSGVLFIVITALRIRSWIATAIPLALKRSFAAGIGLFVMFIGLNQSGLIRLGTEDAPVKIGELSAAGPLLAALCIVVISILMIRRVPGAILIGMLVTTVLAFFTGLAQWPGTVVSAPPSLEPLWLSLDLRGALSPGFLPIVLVFFILAFVDTMGTLIGVSARAGLLDEHHNLPEIEKPMMADAVATTAAGLLGTSTTGAFIESAAGIEAGAKSGFASLVTAGLFVLCLFFSPVLLAVPPEAWGSALIVVGFLMINPIRDLPFDDYTELFPAVSTMVLMAFTYNIGLGMGVGFVLYPVFKLVAGRVREVTAGTWVLFAISLLLFVIYPYGKV